MFSPYLAQTVGVNSATVRKDFSVFGISGKKRGGYAINELLEQIDRILGKNEVLNVVLVGAGNLGRALMHYRNFAKEGIHIAAVFELDPSKCSAKENPPIVPVAEMEPFIRANDIHIGLIAVPEMIAQEVAETMVKAGIVGILNFAPIQLRVPSTCAVRDVNLALEIDALAYYAIAGRMVGENTIPDRDSVSTCTVRDDSGTQW